MRSQRLVWWVVSAFLLGCHPFTNLDAYENEDGGEDVFGADAAVDVGVDIAGQDVGDAPEVPDEGSVDAITVDGFDPDDVVEATCELACVVPNAVGACEDGVCVIVGCDETFEDCDGDVSTGCEASLQDDPRHCGMCDQSCGDTAQEMRVCAEGRCDVAGCQEGFADCDDEPSTCEADLTSALTCTGCDVACRDGELCAQDGCEDLVLAVGSGMTHTCALMSSGDVWCWGDNSFRQLGPNASEGLTQSAEPVFVLSGAVSLVVGGDASCAIEASGAVWCWGSMARFGLGSQTPGSLVDLSVLANQGIELPENIVSLSIGSSFMCLLSGNGEVWCMGQGNTQGQLGFEPSGSLVTQFLVGPVQGLSDVVQIASGSNHTCALTQGGVVRCWGKNTYGAIGSAVGQYTSYPTPVQSAQLFDDIGVGGDHSCASSAMGITCWGDNAWGQLGLGFSNLEPRVMPGEVQDISQFGSPVNVEGGFRHTCAIFNTGAQACWGQGVSGQRGDGTTSSSSVPLGVLGTPAAADIALGGFHTCMADEEGAVWCWGYNFSNQVSPLDEDQLATPLRRDAP